MQEVHVKYISKLITFSFFPSEQFISILDDNKGNPVYIHHGHKNEDDDFALSSDDLTNVSCDGLQFEELAKKAQEAVNSAKFSLRLACSPKYFQYEGVWPSCKENRSQVSHRECVERALSTMYNSFPLLSVQSYSGLFSSFSLKKT